jgi:hypothetical protein
MDSSQQFSFTLFVVPITFGHFPAAFLSPFSSALHLSCISCLYEHFLSFVFFEVAYLKFLIFTVKTEVHNNILVPFHPDSISCDSTFKLIILT